MGPSNTSQAQIRYGETFFLPTYGEDPSGYPLSGALTLLLNGQLSIDDVWNTLLQAANSQDSTLAPLLKDIAYAYQDNLPEATHLALYALWRLGEPTSYFVDLAQNYQGNIFLAERAIMVIAARPHSSTLSVIQPLRQASGNGFIQGAVNFYEAVLHLETSYETYTPEEQSWLLMNLVKRPFWLPSSNCNHCYGGILKGDTEGELKAHIIWAHEKLLAFVAAYPHLIQQRIHEIGEARTEELPASQQAEWRAYLEAYLTEVAFPNGVPPSTEH